MFGIPDPWVWLVYLLCLCSSLVCVLYSWRNWNRGDEVVREEDVRWAAEEDKLERDL
jgi:hypothetical protein